METDQIEPKKLKKKKKKHKAKEQPASENGPANGEIHPIHHGDVKAIRHKIDE